MKLATLTRSSYLKLYNFAEQCNSGASHITRSISSQLSKNNYSAIQINGNNTLILAE